MASAFERALGEPWLIHEPALWTILEIADRQPVTDELIRQWKAGAEPAPSLVELEVGAALSDEHPRVRVRDGVAVVPVQGPIFRYANLFTAFSGGTALSSFARDFRAALASGAVRSILLNVDSPGGEARGIAEMAQAIRNAGGTKPVAAYTGGSSASAAYWLSAATGEVTASTTALVGSIGTVVAMRDTRERDAKAGVREVKFVSSQSPLKHADPTSEAGAAQLQALVDRLTEEFVGAVARYRRTDAETVLRDFGQGGVLVGEDARRAGMVDRIGTFEDTLQQMTRAGSKPAFFVAAGGPRSNSEETHSMTDTTAPAAESGAAPVPAATPAGTSTYTKAQLDEAVAKATAEATAAERTRWQTVLGNAEAEGRQNAARAMLATDMAADDLVKVLASLPQQSPYASGGVLGLGAAMAAEPNPTVGAAAGGDTQPSQVDSILNNARAAGVNLKKG